MVRKPSRCIEIASVAHIAQDIIAVGVRFVVLGTGFLSTDIKLAGDQLRSLEIRLLAYMDEFFHRFGILRRFQKGRP